MTDAAKIQSLDDAKLHLVRQEAMLEEREKHVEKWQRSVDQSIVQIHADSALLNEKITKLRGNLLLICGIAAGGGGTLGTLLGPALKFIGG